MESTVPSSSTWLLRLRLPKPFEEDIAELISLFSNLAFLLSRFRSLSSRSWHLIAFLARAREEGLSFGLGEFRHLVLVKRNKQSPRTFLVPPRPGRHVIEEVPYRDEKWRE
ncbi:hypothetical protein Bca52824_054137 [Brassica carinata]|uniref:Uncharacterized protein n=1 Tax=Brassica carinata TaxID=52824 RepID=A0A8X7ULC1_BRACI|nr:hypothetical protein Bca52824_054137 [Brassica carinata]